MPSLVMALSATSVTFGAAGGVRSITTPSRTALGLTLPAPSIWRTWIVPAP
ncbi:hypothetical protein [Halomonas sp. 707D7]|uniref:hypothetical protein n=1 Tax=unclassified Halomonas TaxID=2609666 RepID=UPI0034613EB4